MCCVQAADRYRLDHLKHMCEEELVNRVEASNAADILSLAHKYNAAPLKSFALAMISRNVEQADMSVVFDHVGMEILYTLLPCKKGPNPNDCKN